jgi:hypothetical protein
MMLRGAPRLALMANLLAALGVVTFTLGLCLREGRSMAVLLVFPVSLALSAPVAPDGVMLTAAAFGAGILSRAMQREMGLSWLDRRAFGGPAHARADLTA